MFVDQILYLISGRDTSIGAGIEQMCQLVVIQFWRQGPGEPHLIGLGQQLLDSADAGLGARPDLTYRQTGIEP